MGRRLQHSTKLSHTHTQTHTHTHTRARADECKHNMELIIKKTWRCHFKCKRMMWTLQTGGAYRPILCVGPFCASKQTKWVLSAESSSRCGRRGFVPLTSDFNHELWNNPALCCRNHRLVLLSSRWRAAGGAPEGITKPTDLASDKQRLNCTLNYIAAETVASFKQFQTMWLTLWGQTKQQQKVQQNSYIRFSHRGSIWTYSRKGREF